MVKAHEFTRCLGTIWSLSGKQNHGPHSFCSARQRILKLSPLTLYPLSQKAGNQLRNLGFKKSLGLGTIGISFGIECHQGACLSWSSQPLGA